MQGDITPDALSAALRMLGETPADVHARLLELGTTGEPRSPWRCPINRYVREFFALPETRKALTGRFFCYVYDDDTDPHGSRVNPPVPWVRVDTPPPVAGFMERFDSGDPTLALPAQEE